MLPGDLNLRVVLHCNLDKVIQGQFFSCCLADKGWSKDKAIAFMRDNTALSDANIEAEVNRYISWPGQALAYKIGELKIRELREYAASELGEQFSLAAFHDVVLDQGAVPLDVLDAHVKSWVVREKQ